MLAKIPRQWVEFTANIDPKYFIPIVKDTVSKEMILIEFFPV